MVGLPNSYMMIGVNQLLHRFLEDKGFRHPTRNEGMGWFAQILCDQPVHWFLGEKALGIQQGTSVWVGSP